MTNHVLKGREVINCCLPILKIERCYLLHLAVGQNFVFKMLSHDPGITLVGEIQIFIDERLYYSRNASLLPHHLEHPLLFTDANNIKVQLVRGGLLIGTDYPIYLDGEMHRNVGA